MAAACASTGARRTVPHAARAPDPPHRRRRGARRGAADGYAIATAALRCRALPYRLGGTDPHGFDCSGLVQYVFAL